MENETSENVRFHYFDGEIEDVQISGEVSNYAMRHYTFEEPRGYHSFRLRRTNVSGDDTKHYDEMTWG